MTKYLWICAGICVCMDLHVLYAYREYYIGGIGSSSEQLRSWNNCFPVKHLSRLSERGCVKYLELYAPLTSSNRRV